MRLSSFLAGAALLLASRTFAARPDGFDAEFLRRMGSIHKCRSTSAS
jgi:hypothetical protein